jgi:glycolate oxidase
MEEKGLERDLRELCGEQVTASGFERWFYTRDFALVPDRIKARFNTLPSAVVRPKTPREVAAVLSYGAHHGIPIVPRGGGSSGLFGAVPKKGGIVVDLMGLSQVIEVNRDRETVTTEAGITWWELDKKLKGQGLTLRSYPSSAKSATVGGWIMTGGRGIGSLKYGPVFDQVLSMEVALADGSSKEYIRGGGLEWFFESEGMLGIATRVTLQVRPIPEMTSHHLIYFDDLENLFEVLQSLVRMTPRPFNIKIYDYKYLSLLRAIGHQVADFKDRSGMLLVTYEGGREEVERGEGEMQKLIALCRGTEIEGAEREWEQRFNILRIKRAVPTIVPTSVIISLSTLKQFYSGLEKLRKRPIALLGYYCIS